MSRKWTESEKQFLIDNPAMPMMDIATHLNRTLSAVRTKIEEMKVKRCERHRYTSSEKCFIRENFHNLSNTELADRFNVTPQAIASYLSDHKLVREKESTLHYFKRQCDEEYAYILGWLFSDGFLSKERHNLTLSIIKEDAEDIRPYMENIYPWSIKEFYREKYPTFRPQLRFTCTRKDIADFLRSEWDFHNKSYGLPERFYTNYISKQDDLCKRCFLRGFIDGDGSIMVKKPYITISKRIDYDWTYFRKLVPPHISHTMGIKNRENSKGSVFGVYSDGAALMQYIYNTPFQGCLLRKKSRAIDVLNIPKFRDKYGPLINE